jgi:hypothetical protein
VVPGASQRIASLLGPLATHSYRGLVSALINELAATLAGEGPDRAWLSSCRPTPPVAAMIVSFMLERYEQ